jgi:hypothetical protein
MRRLLSLHARGPPPWRAALAAAGEYRTAGVLNGEAGLAASDEALVPKQARNGRVEGGASQPVSFTAILRLIFARESLDFVFDAG